jgi:predicted DNA-binding protein
MPSQKPRIALTLAPELQVALTNLAEAVGKPVATVASELLHEMIPQLEGLTKFAKVAKSGNKPAMKRALVHMLGDNMAEMMTMHQAELDLARKGKKS